VTRPLRALVDAEALRHNLRQVRTAAPGRGVIAVIKADGYGHGLLRVAHALAEAEAFGVACLDEALRLRGHGVRKPLLLLEGFFEPAEIEPIVQHGLDVVLHHPWQVEALESARVAGPVRVWVKLDTGMHRLGFPAEQAPALWQRLTASGNVAAPVRFMTHLARADEREDPATRLQLERLRVGLAGLPVEVSVANSAGVLAWPESHGDWVRPGIMLYGVSPFPGRVGVDEGLRPVMTLETRLISVNRCPPGAAVGYGGGWVCPEEMPVGVAAVGYGDGYPRHVPTGTPVLVNGRRVPLIGRVSMDMVTLDLRPMPQARPGDRVVLWGEGLPAEDVAKAAGTIAYQLLSGLTTRVPRVTVGETGEGVGSAGASIPATPVSRGRT
jgi:alanine racemase